MSTQPQPARSDVRRTEVSRATLILNRAGIYVVVVILAIIGFAIKPKVYFSPNNISAIFQAISLLGMVAVGLSFVVYSANFNDMSVPMTIAFSGMVAVTALPYGFFPSVLLGILSGMSIGLINGLMIGKFRAHPIIWSMAFNFVVSGIVRWMYGGNQVYPDVAAGANQKAAETFFAISRSHIGTIPVMVLVMIVMFAVGQFVLTRTRFGNQLKVVGSNYEVARLSGINVTRAILITYLINALCASICGIFLASLAKTGAYNNGEGYDFQGVTAVLLGGMVLAGGKGDLIGVFGGALTVGMLANVMNLIGVPTFHQYLVQGVVFLFIVWLNTASSRKLGKSE